MAGNGFQGGGTIRAADMGLGYQQFVKVDPATPTTTARASGGDSSSSPTAPTVVLIAIVVLLVVVRLVYEMAPVGGKGI